MSTDGAPITSHHTVRERLVRELKDHLASPARDIAGASLIVGWYLKQGLAAGLERVFLESALSSAPEAKAIAQSLTPPQVEQGRPPPRFVYGQSVEVIVNAKNITYHQGVIRDIIWHHKYGKWNFFIEEKGRKVSKGYDANDLRAIGD